MVESYQDFDFAPELCCQPQCLAAFIGLDYQTNPIHKSIWEIFSSNRHPDRVPMDFTCFPLDFVLPTQKPKASEIPSCFRQVTQNHRVNVFFACFREHPTSGMYRKGF